jgi:hypothetical protein
MFSNKFNPDVMNEFKNSDSDRNNNKFELKNIPYKIIITDTSTSKINTTEDLIIKIKEDNTQLNTKYSDILTERKIKSVINLDKSKIEEVKKQLSLNNLNDDVPEDFDDIKSEFKSEFKKQEEDLKNDRNKFNSILESLLSDGILD